MTITLPENLTLQQMPSWLKSSGAMQQPVTQVDFSQVKSSDSSVLALLLYWQANLDDSQPLEVVGFPENLQPLLELYDLQAIVKTL